MAQLTKGSVLYTIDPDDETLLTVGCVTSINGIDTQNEQIEITCMADLARSYTAGLATPGTATFGINADGSDASHIRLHQLKVAGTTLLWALGWGDGTAAPTVDSGGTFDLDTGRTWLLYNGYMNSFPFDFQLNAVVQSTVGIQISGEPSWIAKST